MRAHLCDQQRRIGATRVPEAHALVVAAGAHDVLEVRAALNAADAGCVGLPAHHTASQNRCAWSAARNGAWSRERRAACAAASRPDSRLLTWTAGPSQRRSQARKVLSSAPEYNTFSYTPLENFQTWHAFRFMQVVAQQCGASPSRAHAHTWCRSKAQVQASRSCAFHVRLTSQPLSRAYCARLVTWFRRRGSGTRARQAARCGSGVGAGEAPRAQRVRPWRCWRPFPVAWPPAHPRRAPWRRLRLSQQPACLCRPPCLLPAQLAARCRLTMPVPALAVQFHTAT